VGVGQQIDASSEGVTAQEQVGEATELNNQMDEQMEQWWTPIIVFDPLPMSQIRLL